MSHLDALTGHLLVGALTPEAPGNAVVVPRLHVRRDDSTVLDDISFRVRRGSVTGLLGPGGGTSALIRAIMGVRIVEPGALTVLGAAVCRRQQRPWFRQR